ncbi:hypothetical protein [Paenibacillus sp. 453mf]|uniref:hypothetical protein n=1 Tax=Paenibacillus sp. 453mf TaxID=1761874 RepID=UPI0008E45011|nr:hypothetical protein [Paenibacillus sp. 453mf]SFS52159.1 spore coat protein B [Paenibacillus sp. 453mf]
MALYDQGMRGLIGRGVKINRGGPDAIEGTLMDVRNDHMVINTKNGLVYVKDSHIKSITDTGRTSGAARNLATPIFANTFLGVMQALRFQQIQINRGGPEKLEGVLVDANQNQLILTMKNQEIVRIPLYHIKSVSALRGGNSENNNSSQGNQGQNNQSDGNQAGGNSQQAANQSGGNQGNRNQSGGNQQGSNQSRGNQQGANQSRGNQSRGQQGAHQSRGNQSRGQQGAHQSRGNQSRGQQGANQSRGNKSKSKGSNNKRSYNK